MRAAQRVGVAPWDLVERPFWLELALTALEAEGQAAADREKYPDLARFSGR